MQWQLILQTGQIIELKLDDQLVGGTVEKAEQRPPGRAPGPADRRRAWPRRGEIGVRENLRLVAEQQNNIACLGLPFEQAQAGYASAGG